MKDDQPFKGSGSQDRKSRQVNLQAKKQNQLHDSLVSQQLEDALESSIAQEQIYFSQLKRRENFKKKNSQSFQSLSNMKQLSENILGRSNMDQSNYNSHLLLGQSVSKRTQIVSIKEVKRYEKKASNRLERFRLSQALDFKVKLDQGHIHKNDKSLKKSLSSSKIVREKLLHEEKEKTAKDQSVFRESEQKQHRNSLDIQQIYSSNSKSLSKQPSKKKLVNENNAYTLYPMAVPFCYENINTTINNLQNLEVESNHSKSSQNQKPRNKLCLSDQKISLKKKKTKENKLLKQLSSSKYFIDLPLDLNEFNYQLDIEVNLEKNRGFQVFMISPQRSSDGIAFEDVVHFKYEMVKIPPNMLRLRVYLLIQTSEDNFSKEKIRLSSQKIEEMRFSLQNTSSEKEWKVWKQIQIPILSSEKMDNEWYKKVKVSIINHDLNSVTIKLNNLLDFNLKLMHQQVPVGYYCLNQDFNGVQLTKLSLLGKEKTKLTQDLLVQGCQGKCQLI